MIGFMTSSSGKSGLAATEIARAAGRGKPIAVAAPGIEAAVIARFLDRVEDVAVLDDVSAPAAVADVDARAGHVVNGAMPHRDGHGHGDLDGGRLLFNPPAAVDQAVIDQAIGRVVVGLGSGRAIDLRQRSGVWP